MPESHPAKDRLWHRDAGHTRAGVYDKFVTNALHVIASQPEAGAAISTPDNTRLLRRPAASSQRHLSCPDRHFSVVHRRLGCGRNMVAAHTAFAPFPRTRSEGTLPFAGWHRQTQPRLAVRLRLVPPRPQGQTSSPVLPFVESAALAESASLGFSVQLDLAADQNVPPSLWLVECQTHVLCAKSYLDADVPFAPSDKWRAPRVHGRGTPPSNLPHS